MRVRDSSFLSVEAGGGGGQADLPHALEADLPCSLQHLYSAAVEPMLPNAASKGDEQVFHASQVRGGSWHAVAFVGLHFFCIHTAAKQSTSRASSLALTLMVNSPIPMPLESTLLCCSGEVQGPTFSPKCYSQREPTSTPSMNF